MTVRVGVDLGGTKIAYAVVDEHHQVLARHRVVTPEGPEAVLEAIVEGVRALDARPTAVGVGAPGPVTGGVLVTAPNLAGFTGPVSLAEPLARALGVPVAAENDATAGVIGEWVAGAGQGSAFLLGVWLGTGIGGGLVLDGRPFRGALGGAGEFGHMCVRQGGALCGCGRRGCVEAYAGRASMEQAVAVAVSKGRTSLLTTIAAEKGKARLTSGVWARALEQRDTLAVEVFDEGIRALAAGIGAAVNLLDLDRVVVGGGVAEKMGQALVDRIATETLPYLMVPDAERSFLVAELGDDAGVIGAAALADALALTAGLGMPAP
jgi:glucokinase